MKKEIPFADPTEIEDIKNACEKNEYDFNNFQFTINDQTKITDNGFYTPRGILIMKYLPTNKFKEYCVGGAGLHWVADCVQDLNSKYF